MSDDADDPQAALPPTPFAGTPGHAGDPEGRIPAVPGRRRTAAGVVRTLHIAAGEGDGSLPAVFDDASGGRSAHRFRPLNPGIADARAAAESRSCDR
ncbi:hypothetical protein ACH4U5_36975 [Streptomyces sp. NPDC020858]|uniref:hypothetical protein n=1 Tax=Streptomyces sp. NPDC020858 TaxID=3365097 RepID=UPI0037B62A6E